MNRLQSIRWQLPATYAAIALLTALALGALLLGLLSVYFRQREADYLQENARLVRENLAALMAQQAGPELLAEQVRTLAFLTQSRIQLRRPDGQLIADSGVPLAARLEVIVAPVEEGFPASPDASVQEGQQPAYAAYIRVHPLPESLVPPLAPLEPADPLSIGDGTLRLQDFEQTPVLVFPERGDGLPFARSGIPAVGTLFGYDLGMQNSLFIERTSLFTSFALLQPEGEQRQVLGVVEMSDTPALGREILRSVALAVAAAGGIAVILGGLAGWLVSRRINRPLLALAADTVRMAGGDLAARAERTGPEELGRLADAFNQMAVRVGDLVTTLRRFVADAAHQLNTPLTTLRVALEYLAPGLTGEDQRRVLARAQTQVTHLERLAAALLRLSRIEGSAPAADHQPLDLVALLAPVGEEYASRAEQAGLEFVLELPKELPVQGDREELTIAFANLLDNAVKFTPAGGRVELSLRVVEGWAQLEVADSGIGIPVEDLPLLFARFHRAGNAAPYPGTGLGLAIVRAVAERHNGQVTALPREQGALFRLRLPLSTR